MVAQTFVSLHLYGYGTVLATIQKKYSLQMGVEHVPLQDFTMDLVLTLCIYDYRRHGGSALPEVRGTA